MASERSKSYVLYIDHIPENFNFRPIPFSPIGFQAQKNPVFCIKHPNSIQNFTSSPNQRKNFPQCRESHCRFQAALAKVLNPVRDAELK